MISVNTHMHGRIRDKVYSFNVLQWKTDMFLDYIGDIIYSTI